MVGVAREMLVLTALPPSNTAGLAAVSAILWRSPSHLSTVLPFELLHPVVVLLPSLLLLLLLLLLLYRDKHLMDLFPLH